MKLYLFFFSLILYFVYGDISDDSYNVGVNDEYPVDGIGPEHELPADNVYDSNEPNNNEPNSNWKRNWRNSINEIIFIALTVQVIILVIYILISRVCCIRIRTQPFNDDYPLKPWSIKNERIYDMSERRYLSKDDAIPSDGDFDTDPEDLEVY